MKRIGKIVWLVRSDQHTYKIPVSSIGAFLTHTKLKILRQSFFPGHRMGKKIHMPICLVGTKASSKLEEIIGVVKWVPEVPMHPQLAIKFMTTLSWLPRKAKVYLHSPASLLVVHKSRTFLLFEPSWVLRETFVRVLLHRVLTWWEGKTCTQCSTSSVKRRTAASTQNRRVTSDAMTIARDQASGWMKTKAVSSPVTNASWRWYWLRGRKASTGKRSKRSGPKHSWFANGRPSCFPL